MAAGMSRRLRAVADAAPAARVCSLRGRVVLVTGASRGLGAAMALALARAGADLILWARDDRRLLRQAAVAQAAAPVRILTQRVDVTRHLRVRQAVRAALRRFGRIDVLINNAGIWDGDAAVRLSRRAWDAVVETDLTSVFFVSQAVAPSMIRRGYGKIINLASTAAVMALPENSVYCSAKAAVVHLTRTLAVEWGPAGIRVVGIAPGVFRTDMTRGIFTDRVWCRKRLAEIPLRRFGEPEELGGLTVFLASSASDHITGQTIIIDGGASLTT